MAFFSWLNWIANDSVQATDDEGGRLAGSVMGVTMPTLKCCITEKFVVTSVAESFASALYLVLQAVFTIFYF